MTLADFVAIGLTPELPGDLLFPSTDWKTWLARGAVAVAVLVAVALLARGRSARRAVAPVDATPVHLDALERLRRLGDAGLDAVAAHVELAAVARTYVAARFAIPASERTSEEVCEALAGNAGVAAELPSTLASVLGACDGVKFARSMPAREDTARRIDVLRQFVERTAERRP